ncbi:hypothetical protein CBR_g21027 [Chara braunii]|uniref:Uncharacterized protein n=1 Tax=Chara braunii TaxID=69332 RepID=A0A388L0L8_CHABU|nr:hypothetical protein CBR_g21027 [Chara braunii]|eukprot:GBG75782.1 hypothetical protein CBR_g21027 [Chara braunii]
MAIRLGAGPPSSSTRLPGFIVESDLTVAGGFGACRPSCSTRRRPIVESDLTMARGFGDCRPSCWTRWPPAGHCRLRLDDALLSHRRVRHNGDGLDIVESDSTKGRGVGAGRLSTSTRQWPAGRRRDELYELDRRQAPRPLAICLSFVDCSSSTLSRRTGRWIAADGIFHSAALQNMEGEGKASKRRASKNFGSMEQSPKKSKGTPSAGVGSQEAPGSKRQCTPVSRGAPSTGTPSTRVRGSGPDKAVLMTGGPAGQERAPGPQQGRSAVEVVPGRKPSGERKSSGERKPSGETTTAGWRDDVPVIYHKDKFWMLDWVGETGQPSSGFVLYVVIKENIVSVGGLVREPVVHPEDRISEPRCVLSKTVKTGPSITIRDTPLGSKAGQIGEKGPCRGLVVPSAPMKTRPTATKAPVALGSRSRYDVATKGHLPLVGQQRYDYTVPSRAEEAHEYFEDEDEENSDEYSERAGGHEQYAAGVSGMTRHPGETSKVVGQDEDSEHTISELGGEVGLAGGYGSSYEGCEGDVHATMAVAGHTDAAGLTERKRKHRQERKSLMDSKRSRQEAGEKRQLKVMPVDEAVQRTRETEAAAKKKQQPKKRKAKGGVMEKTSIFPAEQPQSDEEAKGKTVTRPPSLRNVPSVTSSGVLSKGFFLELDKRGNQCPDMEFIYVQFDIIMDIPDGEFRYNQRYLVQQTVDDIYDAMVASGEAAMRERMIGAAGVNVCTLEDCESRRVLPDDFDLEYVNKYYYYPLSGQHNVAAARRCFVERPDIAQELRLDRWTARPVYYPDKSMDNYGTLSTFQNAKDKWNTPPHQIMVIQNIRKLWHESNCPEAKGGSAAEVKNEEYRKFAGEALRLTEIRNLIDMSLTTQWSGQWSNALGPYMLLARATDDIFEKVKQVYAAWETGQLPGRDAVKPATKQGESGKAPRAGLGFELKGGVRYPVHWVQGTKGPGYLVAVHDPDIRAWKPFSALGRRERLQLLRDILTGSVILTPKQSGAAQPSTPAADRSSDKQVGNVSALVRRERRPKMLVNVVEKNFTPTKLKMAGMEPREKFAYEGMETEPNAMVETLEHFCPADEAVVFLGKGHAVLIWELLKSHRHCIVLEGEGIKFEFLVQFVTKMVKSGLYFANFAKPPPRHDEKRDLIYKIVQNSVNIWEFLFENKPQNKGERAYVVRRRKMESLLRGYHKAPEETEVAFLDHLEMMYFDEQIGAFTIAAYATCFGEGFDAEDSEEESEDGTLQAALADERQKACNSVS